MATYRVSAVRIEHVAKWIEVQANSADEANSIVKQRLHNGEIDFSGAEIVYADEFVNDHEEI